MRFQHILQIKAACQMQYALGVSSIESVQLLCHLHQVCFVLHMTGWWLGIKGKRVNSVLELHCFIELIDLNSRRNMLLFSLMFFIYEFRFLFPLMLYHAWQYDGFLTRNVSCLQGIIGQSKGSIKVLYEKMGCCDIIIWGQFLECF